MRGEFASGWRVLLACFLGAAIGVSSLYFYSLGIFIKPMQAEFGWTRAEGALGALVGTACAALTSTPAGWLADRIGSAPVAIGSLVALALGFAALGAFTTNLSSFLIVTALLSLLSTASSPLPFTRLIVSAFDRYRGLALGITLAGVGLGAILTPRLLTPYVGQHGWRNGYFALAAVIACLIPFVWLLLRGANDVRHEHVEQARYALLRQPAFFLLAAIFLITSVAVLGTVVHFVPMLADNGMTPQQAGAAASFIGFAAIGGRLATGLTLDHVPAKWVTSALLAAAAAGLAFIARTIVSHTMAGAVVLGLTIGAEGDLLAFLVSRYFPHSVFGRAYGTLYTAFLIGGALGPYIAGRLFDQFASYTNWLFLASALLALAALFSALLPPVDKAQKP